MKAINTKEVFDLFFNEKDEEYAKKIRPQVDRPEVYAYEKQLGKRIFDMDVDELIGMLSSFNGDRKYGESNYDVSYATIQQISSQYRFIWNYYIDNIEIIKNPWNNRKMRGVTLFKVLAENREPITYDIIEKAIKSIRIEYSSNIYMANYLECLLLLFYNGFAKAEEIVLLKEDMINFKNHTIILKGRTIHLSERCFILLQYIHNLDLIETSRGNYKALPYEDGYFKFVIRENQIKKFKTRDVAYLSSLINRKIINYIKKKFQLNINYRTIYLLGFYDFIVSKVGREQAQYLVTSVRDTDATQELMHLVNEYGVSADNMSYVKRCLRPFI